MNDSKPAIVAWVVCALLILATLFYAGRELLTQGIQRNILQLLGDIAWGIIPVVFGIMGALLLSRQSRNVIGWLMMLPATLMIFDGLITQPLMNAPAAPADPSLLFIAVVWFSNAGWILLILPVLFIAQLFPTGAPLTPRWRRVVVFGIVWILLFFAITIFARELGPDLETYGVDWTITNPIGFIPSELGEALIFPWWVLGLAILTLVSAASLILRYRRAVGVEKEQIKWLLYVGGLFALVYAPLLLLQGDQAGFLGDLTNLALPLAILGFPIAIGISILRYRLWDIDVIVRRTLTYALVTAFLAIIFFGSIVVLQQLFVALTNSGGDQIVTVVSTLAIAALFVPVRNRVQTEIDKRFNRKKYNAQQILQDFGQTVRDETDLDTLASRLMQVVDDTMQPKTVSVWLRKEQNKSGNR